MIKNTCSYILRRIARYLSELVHFSGATKLCDRLKSQADVIDTKTPKMGIMSLIFEVEDYKVNISCHAENFESGANEDTLRPSPRRMDVQVQL